MKTNTAIIGLVLVVSLTACGALIYYGMQDDSITIEMEVRDGVKSTYFNNQPVVGGPVYLTYTSASEDKFVADYPDIVFEKDGQTMRFSASDRITWTSGAKMGIYLWYYTGEPVDIDGWDYHFILSRNMEVSGKYTLIVKRGLQTLPDW